MSNWLYIKFKTLYWSAFLPNVRNFLFCRLIYRIIPVSWKIF